MHDGNGDSDSDNSDEREDDNSSEDKPRPLAKELGIDDDRHHVRPTATQQEEQKREIIGKRNILQLVSPMIAGFSLDYKDWGMADASTIKISH